MSTPLPPLPPENSQNWYPHYAAIDAAVRNGTAGGGGTGAVSSVNGQTGAVTLAASDVGAVALGYKPLIADLPPLTVVAVTKDAATGFWPTDYTINGAPIYTGGSGSTAVRPTGRADVVVLWIGAEPSPPSVTTGTGGMRPNDLRFIPG